jgi:CheY-like chemotaxis protein
MAALLQVSGHEVVESATARNGIAQHQATPFDLIVTDLVMREMDGTELVRRVRALSPRTPIIGVSGDRHSTIYLNMATMLGATRVLQKPFTREQFLDAVNAALATDGNRVGAA